MKTIANFLPKMGTYETFETFLLELILGKDMKIKLKTHKHIFII